MEYYHTTISPPEIYSLISFPWMWMGGPPVETGCPHTDPVEQVTDFPAGTKPALSLRLHLKIIR